MSEATKPAASGPVDMAPPGTGAGTPAPLLQIDNVTKLYRVPGTWARGAAYRRALDDVSLYLYAHETLGVVGESGSGKSTLARVALRLTDADYGQVAFDGEMLTGLNSRALRPIRRRLQPVSQNPRSSLDPALRVLDIVREGVHVSGQQTNDPEKAAQNWLLRVGLGSAAGRRHPAQLSGGEAQRVAIARALAVRPRLLVLDEPVASLDISVRAQIINLLLDVQGDLGLGYLFISHDIRVVRYVSHRIAVMYLGRVVETGPAATVCDAPAHPYTRELLNAAPRLELRRKRLRVIPEGQASAGTPSDGCLYSTRCPRAEPGRCDQQIPVLRTHGLESAHVVACHHPLGEPSMASGATDTPLP